MTEISIIQLVQEVLQRPLSSLEQLILIGSWEGSRYGKMAQESGYGEEYLKQVGAKLWGELSQQLGMSVSKKNLRLIFSDRGITSLGQGLWPPSITRTNGLEVSPPAGSSNPMANPQGAWPVQGSGTGPVQLTLAFPSGPLPLDSPFYIHRPLTEDIACAEIDRPGALLCIKAPRQFGKTSLLWRVIHYAEEQGYRVCPIDFQEADSAVFQTTEALMQWLCRRIGYNLNLQPPQDSQWDPDLGGKVNCGLYLQQVVLAQSDRPLVLAINALEQVFVQAVVAQDLFSMLRFWHEQSKSDGFWQRLRLVLVYSTDSYVPLNLEVSPFNVGRSVRLPPFTLEQFMELGRRYQLYGLESESQKPPLEALYRLIAGHPYLANLSFYTLKQEGKTLAEVLETAISPSGVFRAHLQALLAQLRQNQSALVAFQQVVQQPGVSLNAVELLQLESLGLVRVEQDQVYPMCDLYQRFFADQLAGPPPTQPLHG